ncbi:cyclic peptide export ABC transporter [Flavobacterium chilense]|uniref:Putative ATP-binding cassette transporter n=1 Tax=Flavobacterium chilense TaxID=946677 RepID=A0A1M6XE55_9FLAO|nr:cyclic peptide export ABC transporter [Flavobacterium chilense]SHL04211.1 putative ATP-binding cassette transporter [Flavobacterium chilense]
MIKLKLKELLYIVFYALSNTILSFGIIYIINSTVSGKVEFQNDYMGIVFVATVVYTYLLNINFQKWLNKLTYDILYKNEELIFYKILKAPLLTLERLGSQRFYTTIEDLRVFSSFPEVVTHTFNSLLMLILCLVYLFTLSVPSAIIVVVLIIVVAFIYFFVINKMAPLVDKLRKYNESYFKYVEDVIKGFKGLKLSSHRSDNLMNKFLAPNRRLAKDLDFNVNFVFLSINLISQYGLYLIIGTILFLLPVFDLLKREDVITYVMILMFISGPINNLINMQRVYTRLFVGKNRIRKFLNDFDISAEDLIETDNKTNEEIDFNELEFENIHFNYQNNSLENSFSLGPVNLSVQKGETIFVIGGNGSGKSTFINILTGLYKPSVGKIILDNQIADKDNPVQNLISAVFTDNYIYSNNYDNYSLENNKRYQELLEVMELDKIILDDKEDSARRNFSKGQSKRMSLIFALLENKPILVLDEWAADQDPHFRKYFYENLLPKLKNEGKTIIAVTHDDAYFKHADRIIKFDYGQIVKDFNVKEESLNSESLWYTEINN